MKKVIVMMSIFALMLTFAALDMFYTTKFYSNSLENLYAADISVQANRKNLNNSETIALCQKANDDWESGKSVLMMLVNHNVVRYVDEKFVALLEQVHGNNEADATVSVKVLISYIKDLRDENYPRLRNIL